MEYYQDTQQRAGETVAVLHEHLPTLKINGVDGPALSMLSLALTPLAQTRDDALAASDGAANAENQDFLVLQNFTIALPLCAEGELNDDVPAESALLDLLDVVYAIQPRTVAAALARGQKLKSALKQIDAYLTGQVPARDPITSGGQGLATLTTALITLPGLTQTVEDRAAEVTTERTNLRTATVAVDRLNKRFYKKLTGEARSNEALAAALGQISTESAGAPGTLGIKSILQGGADNLHLLVSYETGTYDGAATSVLEWMVTGLDTDFTKTAPADPSGNTAGPFAVGSIVKLRTRVSNANGTTTSSVRTITVLAPAG